jgi:hypothetical protein
MVLGIVTSEDDGASSSRACEIWARCAARGTVPARDGSPEGPARTHASVGRTAAFPGEGWTVAQRSRAQFEKRQKELARQDRQKLKRARRAEARDRKTQEVPAPTDTEAAGGEDGPPPPPEEP